MTGNEYKRLIGRYLVSAYGMRGIKVYWEVPIGTSIIGKQRRVDLLLLEPTGRALALECKYQDSSGTVDEKMPYALKDLEALRVPAAVVYAGSGFSEGVLHLLQSSSHAAYCAPDDSLQPIARRRSTEPVNCGTWQLDHVLAVTFGWWDILVESRSPIPFEP